MDAARLPPAAAYGQEPQTAPIPTLDSLLELDKLTLREKDKVFDCLLRLLANPNVAQLLESDPGAQDRFLRAVQTLPCTTYLTPAATPTSAACYSPERTSSPDRVSHVAEHGTDIIEGVCEGGQDEGDLHGSPLKRKQSDRTSPEVLATGAAKKRRRSRREHAIAPDFGQEIFAKLPPFLRAAFWRMKDEGARNAWLFFRSRRETCELRLATASDPRPRQLRDLIENWIDMEKSLQGSALVYRVSKRVHLVELAAAKEAMQGKPEIIHEQLTDLVFPELITYKRPTKRGSSPYYQAKRKLEYWLRLGTPLLRLVECYGYAILLLFPDVLTDTV
ncbi:hypothetical protein GQ53DRAFT_689299, partial [Thozetella sp. PMI_491]